MNRPRIIALFALAISAAGLLWVIWSEQREPSYEGKSLSEWLKAYRTPFGAMAPIVSQQAADAVRHIGTNALPFLVRWIQQEEDFPKWKEPLFSAVYRWKLGTPGRQGLLELVASREIRAGSAFWGFVILGETARPAIPDLVRIAKEKNPRSANAATTALGYLGKDALPPLLSMITNTAFPPPTRHQALTSLGQMRYLGTNAHPAVVLLVSLLRDPDLAVGAADIVGRLHLESDICVPTLAEFLSSTDHTMRMWAVISLGRFGTTARAAAPELVKMLGDSDTDVRNEATNALQHIAPEVPPKTEVP